MTKHIEEYRNPEISRKISQRIQNISKKPIRLMEVCGTHTMSIFRNGIRSVLPDTITLLSGPGCPVCVTDQKEIDAFIEIARKDNVIVTTFGDLMRVPGSDSSLQKERAEGRDVRMVYAAFDAVNIAKENPDKQVVFFGVGFETTAPTIAASIISAQQLNVNNFSIFSAHKLVPPALCALMKTENIRIDGFILPGHVSVVIGTGAYMPFFEKYQIPCVVAGFEPTDILSAILALVEQIESTPYTPKLENAYLRAVTVEGNLKAKKIMDTVFETTDAIWRGLGKIEQSGLEIRPEFESFDARKVFDIPINNDISSNQAKGCACGEILCGLKTPPDCPLYKKVCTPLSPVGPCMVSSEGTCAAYYRYHGVEI